MIGQIHNMAAIRLLSSLPDSTASAVILDPPAQLGVGNTNDETQVDEMIAALDPIAKEAYRILWAGGATIFIGEPQSIAAWEVAAAWANLRLAAEFTVLWDTGVHSRGDVPSLTTSIRWHIRPGLRYLDRPQRQVQVQSNVMVCHRVPIGERLNPAQRPVELFNFLISTLTDVKEVVVDPFCGAGSALVAAEMCDRRWVGGDLDPAQCLIATKRVARVELEEAYLQPFRLWRDGRLIPVEG